LCIAANGDHLPPQIILPLHHVDRELVTAPDYEAYYIFKDTGWQCEV